MLVGRDGGAIVATAMVGHDGHRGWVYYVAIDPGPARQGPWPHDHAGGRGLAAPGRHRKTATDGAARQRQVQAFYQSIGYGEQQRIIYAKWLDGRALTP